MSAVITKKRARVKTSTAAEAADLARYLAGHLGATISISESAFHNWPLREQLDRAVCILGRVSDPLTFEAMHGTPDGDLSAMLQEAKETLDLEIVAIERDAGRSLSGALHDGSLARHVRDCLVELIDAYESGAEGIDSLRRLATYDGAMASMFSPRSAEPRIRAEEPVHIAPLARAEVDENPHFLMGQALAVLQSAAESDGTSDSLWGLRNLAIFCGQCVDQALEDRQPRSYSEASAAIASLIDLMGLLGAVAPADTLVHAAQSLLQLAKTEFDGQWHALEQAEKDAAHA
ncbi:hypothetical protein [Pseudorhodoferax sp. Leaf274]|uniref:hypothetical protein n=1 Tax=Pseudorhodoferax sp. Leaf274 TaxID=1736318 RepID=UPI000702B305|nr:hypothetical protein [Pseudorhodoferax sp. Leaf274]KQP43948.1 hypothetical protein ASF44_28895 [Pseudorhodoferax sp. Leaf274]